MAAQLLGAGGPLASPARATWESPGDLIYGTAHTLEQGEFEVGLFNPLMYGISDRVQLSLHPVLLLILAPQGGIRWRFYDYGPLHLAANLESTFSFLDRVDNEGRRVIGDGACGSGCGFPGIVQTTVTATWEAADWLTLSVGGGPAVDFRDFAPHASLTELHASGQWRLGAEDLFMVHASTYLGGADTAGGPADTGSRSNLQVLYAHAFGNLRVAGGVVLGETVLVTDEPTVRTLPGRDDVVIIHDGATTSFPIFPVVDLWLRL